MDYSLGNLIASALGSAATTFALLFGFYTYRAAHRRDAFEKLRVDFIELKDLMREIDRRLDSGLFLQLSRRFGEELRRLVSEDKGPEGLKALFKDKKHHSSISRAFVLAQQRTGEVREIHGLFSAVNKLVAKNRGVMPISVLMLDRCVMMSRRVFVTSVRATDMMDDLLTNDKVMEELYKYIDSSDSFEYALTRVEGIASDGPNSYISNIGQPIIDITSEFMSIIVSRITTASDAEISRISRIELRQDSGEGLAKEKVMDALDHWTGQVRETFSQRDWDSAKKLLGRLDQFFSK